MASVIDKTAQPEVRPATESTRRPRSRFVLVVAFVLVGLLGFGVGWLAFRDTGTDVPDGIDQLLEDFIAGWNEGDGDAVVAVMAPGARHYPAFPEGISDDELVAFVDGLGVNNEFRDFEIESVVGDDPYVVVQRGTVYGTDGYSMYHITEVNGELRITMHFWVE